MTPDERERERIRSDHIAGWVGLFSALACVAAAITIAIQALLWLKNDRWPPVSVAAGLDWLGVNSELFARTSWHGFNRIVAWVLDLHLGVGFIAAGALIGFCIGEVTNAVSRARRSGAA